MARNIFVTLAFILSITMAACSGSSSFDSGIGVEVASPADDSQFTAGGRIDLVINTRNFRLGPPNNFVSDVHAREDEHLAHTDEHSMDEHSIDEHSMDEHSMDEHSMDEHSMDEHSMDEHSMDEHPDAYAVLVAGSGDGHYHLYLDAASDADVHITAWDHQYSYQLPADISSGTHSLRVELRNNDHTSTGIDDVVFFNVQ